MITRDDFPYLQQLIINDAYAVKNLTIPVFERGKKFKHLILTGKNGSGKTTILCALMKALRYDTTMSLNAGLFGIGSINVTSHALNLQLGSNLEGKVIPVFDVMLGSDYVGLIRFSPNMVLSHFEANRKIQIRNVSTIMNESELQKNITSHYFEKSPGEFFKQYLVNKKVYQVFDAMEGKAEDVKQQEDFFAKLEETLAKIFEDPGTKLEFVRENFEFYINLSDGRRFTLDQLSAGFSAFLTILTELLMRTDLLRKQANDYTYDPCGFVLIDEPETHLHLEMQYQILPLLTSLFPNLQFIVATHSPAVASSIKGATVFDLSTGEVLGDEAAGSSFSELMQTHFGVENEYSNVADAILAEVAEISEMPDRAAALIRLQRLLDEQGHYMSPVLRLDVQARLLHLQREQAA